MPSRNQKHMEHLKPLAEIGKIIAQKRESLLLNQSQFSVLVDVGVATISNIELARNFPSLQTLRKISQKAGIPMTEFYKAEAKEEEEFDMRLHYAKEFETAFWKRVAAAFGDGTKEWNGLLDDSKTIEVKYKGVKHYFLSNVQYYTVLMNETYQKAYIDVTDVEAVEVFQQLLVNPFCDAPFIVNDYI